MSRHAPAAALAVAMLLAGCGPDEPSKIPLGKAATLAGSVTITPHAVFAGKPADLASLTVRHVGGSDEPAPPGTPYYVPATLSGEGVASAHKLLRAVDGDGDEVAALDEPLWKSGTSPCESFTFREGDTVNEVDDDCVVFVLPDGAELDHLTARWGGEQVAWAVPDKGSPPASPSAAPSPVVRSDEEACGGDPFKASAVRVYNPNAAAYAGPGVHPIRLFKPGVFDAGDVPPHLPTEWGSRETDRIQLVVCEYLDPSFRDRKIDTCTYVGGYRPSTAAEVRTARWVYRVFEARTGRLVTTFKLTGTTSAAELCPDETYAPASVYFQRVTSKALAGRLGSLVSGNAPGG